MSEVKLELCPFCGITPSLRLITMPTPIEDAMFMKVGCNRCGKYIVNSVPEICDWTTLQYIKDRIIFKWNNIMARKIETR